MSAIVRASRPSDLEALYEMAKLAGPGFTNLPADRKLLAAKLAASEAAFGRKTEEPGDYCFLLVLEDVSRGRVIGTAQIFAKVGERWPFYSYRIGTLSQSSAELGRTFRAEMLNLATDYEGCTEVGGLFLHPHERASGLGLLLARSRYLFIGMHRHRFADRVIAELRGMIDEAGASPFWDGLAGKFFGMTFQEADSFNATHGNQFIADLMPKHPIYTAMLPENARLAIGRPHPGGRAAMRMLENEGFRFDGYIDIFDGGPTMVAATDAIRSIAEARSATVIATDNRDEDGHDKNGAADRVIAATGRLGGFRACNADVAIRADGVAIDAASAHCLDIIAGDGIVHVPR